MFPSIFSLQIKDCLTPVTASDEQLISTMKKCWQEKQYILDPHTAVGFTDYYRRYID